MKKITCLVLTILILVLTMSACSSNISEESVNNDFSLKLEQINEVAKKHNTTIIDSDENEMWTVDFEDYDIYAIMCVEDGSINYYVSYRSDNCDFDDDFYNLYIDLVNVFYDIDGEVIKEHIETAIENSKSKKTYNYEKPLRSVSSLTVFFNKFSNSDYEISINKI